MSTTQDIIATLKDLSSPQYHAGTARFGIDNSKALGVKSGSAELRIRRSAPE